MYTYIVFGVTESVLFIEVSSFQGVQISAVPFGYTPSYTCTCTFSILSYKGGLLMSCSLVCVCVLTCKIVWEAMLEW